MLKEANFNFSKDKENFKIDEYALKSIFRDEEIYEKFSKIYKKGVDANIALATLNLKDEEYRELSRKIDKDKTFSPSATSAYFLSKFSVEDTNEIAELSKKHKINPNDYDFWINTKKKHNIQRIDELLKLGVPLDRLQKGVQINDEQIKEALSLATEYKLSKSDTIELYQYSSKDKEVIKRGCELLRDNKLEVYTAYSLAQQDKRIADETITYLKRGINLNNAFKIANLEKDSAYKEKIISLLDTLEYIYEAQQLLDFNLSEEEFEKVLDLIKKGANIYFAKFCLDSPKTYEKIMSVYEAGQSPSLDGLYGGWEEDVLKNIDYLALGVPNDQISFFSRSATEEELELLKNGLKYEALKPLKKYEEEGNDSTLIKEYLKKGLSFETALNLSEITSSSDIDKNIILENTHQKLNEYRILALAKIQKERGSDWINQKEKEILTEFVSVLKDVEHLDKFIDYGFMNSKAMTNYNEFIKRGITSKNSNEALMLSQLDFKDSSEFDRATELLKRKIPFKIVLFSFKDDKSFINAINNPEKEPYGDHTILNSYLLKFYIEGIKKEDIEKIGNKFNYYAPENTLNDISKYINKGHTVDDAISISDYNYYSDDLSTKPEATKEVRDFISNLILQGCHFTTLKDIFYDKRKITKLNEFLEQGIEPKLASKLALCNISPGDNKKVAKIKTIETSTIKEDLKKDCANPTLHPFIDELYNFENYTGYQLRSIINSKITIEEILASGKIFIKSPLKQAIKRPNLYLSNIPKEETEKINGQYPTLSKEKTEEYQRTLIEFFKTNLVEITRALKYLDTDTFNQMMDKRTKIFSEQLNMLNKMDDKHYELVSKITKCRKTDGKLLSSKEKIDLAKIVLYHQLGYIDTTYLEKIVEKGTVDVEKLNNMIFEKLIETIGLTKEEAEKHRDKLNFDEEYMHLLLRTQKSTDFLWLKEIIDNNEINETINFFNELLNRPEDLAHEGLTEETTQALIHLLKRVDTMEEKEIYREFSDISPFNQVEITPQDIAKIAILKSFKEYIQDETNEIGQTNAKTKAEFKRLGLNYEKWLNYEKEDYITFQGDTYNIKMWDRNPQKDLFMGNRTSCCTAIIDGANGKATPIYLANTAFNVVEMTDSKGNIVAMSRIFVANVDEKPSIIVENIEINNSFLKNKSEKELTTLREKMFEYIKNIASQLLDSETMNVYFSKNYTHVPTDNFEIQEKTVDFVGEISADSIYLNCKPGWTRTEELKDQTCSLYAI